MNQHLLQPQGWIVSDLVRKAQAGDEAARQELLTQSAPIIQGAMSKAFSPHPPQNDLQDLQQDVYVKVLENLDTLKNPDAYPSWLFQLTLNHCRDVQKRRREVLAADTSEDNDFVGLSSPQLPIELNQQQAQAEQDGMHAKLEAARLAQHLPPGSYKLLYRHYGLDTPLSELRAEAPVKKSAYYERIRSLELHMLLTRAAAEHRLSNYPEATRLLRLMVDKLRRPDESRETQFLYASALTRLADIYQVQGAILGPHEALVLYEQVIPVWRRLRDKHHERYAIHMIGLCYNIVDQINTALDTLKEVEEGLPVAGSQARSVLGNLSRDFSSIYLKAGNISLAKRYGEQSLPLLEGQESAAYRAALRAFGDVRLQEGKPDEALAFLEQSLHRVPTDQALLYTQGYIAFCRLWLSLDKVGEALNWADKARHYCIEYGFKHQRLTLDRLLA
jgi:DNA-directed RNA polymerase specialized sigma24 family protein